MRILALSVFEGVIYHCTPLDLQRPDRITLEVDALLRPGDADATSGPLLLPVADYIAMIGIDEARPHLRQLADRGRIVVRLGVDHIAFPTWTNVGPAPLAGVDPAGPSDRPGPGEPDGPRGPVPLVVAARAEPALDDTGRDRTDDQPRTDGAHLDHADAARDAAEAARTGQHPCLDPVGRPEPPVE